MGIISHPKASFLVPVLEFECEILYSKVEAFYPLMWKTITQMQLIQIPSSANSMKLQVKAALAYSLLY